MNEELTTVKEHDFYEEVKTLFEEKFGADSSYGCYTVVIRPGERRPRFLAEAAGWWDEAGSADRETGRIRWRLF